MDSLVLIKKMPKIHCARGAKGCEKCRVFLEEGESFCLIRVFLESTNVARPVTEIYVGCRRIIGEYEVLKRFDSKDEAKKYAIQHKIEIIFD
ncbi:MAG: hypothetical protein ACOC44_02665 [Promethearchaeia archaeon]